MGLEEPPDLPDGMSPIGSLPGQNSQLTPEELASQTGRQIEKSRLKNFIDLDEAENLSRDEKIRLVQEVSGRFASNYLSGMNGTVGNGYTLRTEVTDSNIVLNFRQIATRLWGFGDKLPLKMRDSDLELLKNMASTDKEGNTSYFASIIREPKVEPDIDNPYTSTDLAYHDARLLDYLIKDLYFPQKEHIVGFSKN